MHWIFHLVSVIAVSISLAMYLRQKERSAFLLQLNGYRELQNFSLQDELRKEQRIRKETEERYYRAIGVNTTPRLPLERAKSVPRVVPFKPGKEA